MSFYLFLVLFSLWIISFNVSSFYIILFIYLFIFLSPLIFNLHGPCLSFVHARTKVKPSGQLPDWLTLVCHGWFNVFQNNNGDKLSKNFIYFDCSIFAKSFSFCQSFRCVFSCFSLCSAIWNKLFHLNILINSLDKNIWNKKNLYLEFMKLLLDYIIF